jgi:hypothetical protein
MIQSILDFIGTPQGQTGIVSLVVFIVGTFLVQQFKPKSKVVWSLAHAFTFLTAPSQQDPGGTLVYTQTIWVQNVGRDIAENVEIHFNFKPAHYELFPARTYDENLNPDNKFSISTPVLTKREYFTIQLISVNSELPNVNNVNWKSGVGKQIMMSPTQQYPQGVVRFITGLFYFGIFALVYLAVKGIAFLAT